MRRRIEVDDEAKAEARHAFAWYLASGTTVALAFEEELSKGIEIIRDEAHTFPTYEGETRRYLLPTFPSVCRGAILVCGSDRSSSKSVRACVFAIASGARRRVRSSVRAGGRKFRSDDGSAARCSPCRRRQRGG